VYPTLPSLNSLKIFDAAARLGSFKKAAEELFITPTAVSHQIKTLEESLETQLFERKTRSVSLTANGRLLAGTTSRIFQQLTAAVSEISGLKDTLTISTTASFAAMWLVPKLERFYRKYPGINISVMTGEVVDDIERDRSIDIAIRYGQYDPSMKNTVKLSAESLGMFAAPSYLSHTKEISQAQLLETKWVNQSLPPLNWESVLGRPDEEFNIRHFDQEHHVIQAALAGHGIALVSSLLVQNALQNGWLVPYKSTSLEGEISGFTYYTVIAGHSRGNKNVETFIQWLLEEIE